MIFLGDQQALTSVQAKAQNWTVWIHKRYKFALGAVCGLSRRLNRSTVIEWRNPANRAESACIALVLVLYPHRCPQTPAYQFLSRAVRRREGESDIESATFTFIRHSAPEMRQRQYQDEALLWNSSMANASTTNEAILFTKHRLTQMHVKTAGPTHSQRAKPWNN